MNEFLSVLFVFVLLVIRMTADYLDRERIRAHVAERGGKVLDIRWVPVWFGSRERTYDVILSTRGGKTLHATCKTAALAGVFWSADALFEEPVYARQPMHEDQSVAEEVDDLPPGPVEPISCLSCGTKIPATNSTCPHCGWTYSAPQRSASS